MYDSQQFKIILRMCGAVLLSLLVANAALVLTSAVFPDWLPRQFFGVDFLVENRERAQGVAELYEEGTLTDDDRFVVILGLSSASEGITLEELTYRSRDSVHFLGLGGAGRNMRDLARYAEPLITSDARPVLAVFAINLFHLVDPVSFTEGFIANMQKVQTGYDFLGIWMLRRRQDVKAAIDFRIDRTRTSLFKYFDVKLHNTADPWREFVRMGLPQTQLDSGWQKNIERYGQRGYYDADSFRRSTIQVGFFVELLTAFAKRNTDIMVVLMPEHSLLRARIPVTAMDALLEPLDLRFGVNMPAVVDLRDSIPDSGFKDISHLNQEGRKLFGEDFAAAISVQLDAQELQVE